MKVLSPEAMKGGVGKSLDAVNVAAYLAYKKKRVLLIDGDYQADTSQFFGKWRDAVINRTSFYDALTGKKTLRDTIVKTDFPFLDFVPSTNDLSQFNDKPRDRYLLRNMIRREDLAKDYDYVIIDSRPELSDLFRVIAVASDAIWVPIFVDASAILGMSLILKTIHELSENKRHTCGDGINFLGVVVNNFDPKFKTQETMLPVIREALEAKHIPILAEIPRSACVSSSQDAGKPIAFMKKHRGLPIGKSFAELARKIELGVAAKPKKGRPESIPLFSERETYTLTTDLIKTEDDFRGGMSL